MEEERAEEERAGDDVVGDEVAAEELDVTGAEVPGDVAAPACTAGSAVTTTNAARRTTLAGTRLTAGTLRCRSIHPPTAATAPHWYGWATAKAVPVLRTSVPHGVGLSCADGNVTGPTVAGTS